MYKQIAVPEELHSRLKERADSEGRKIYGLAEHLIELGEEYEKILKRSKVVNYQQQNNKEIN